MSNCAQCGKNDAQEIIKYKQCAGCKNPFYCSPNCQKQHWPIHKQICPLLQAKPTLLLDPIEKRDSDTVNLYIQQGASVHVTDRKRGSLSPLFLAALLGDLGTTQALVEAGAMVDQPIDDGSTPLHAAVAHKQLQVVCYLLRKNANRNRKLNGQTPLGRAAKNGYVEIAQALMEGGATTDIPDEIEALRHLCRQHPNSNRNLNGQTPLWRAAESGNLELVQALAEESATVDLPNEDGVTPLHAAVTHNQLQVVRYLLRQNADPNRKVNGQTPLGSAIKNGYLEIAYALIEGGAATDVPDEIEALRHVVRQHPNSNGKLNGETPLGNAAENGNLGLVQALAQESATVDLPDEVRATPLYLAAENNHAEVVHYLLSKGADPNNEVHRLYNGETPLSRAAAKGYLKIVQALVGKGALIEATNDEGTSPLHAAAYGNHLPIVKFLIFKLREQRKKGYINQIEAKYGATPFLIAASWGFETIVKYLIKTGADFRKTNNEQKCPLEMTARKGNRSLLVVLLNAYAWDPQSEDSDALEKALRSAAWLGRQGTFDLLNKAIKEGLESFRQGMAPPWAEAPDASPPVVAASAASLAMTTPPTIAHSILPPIIITPPISPRHQRSPSFSENEPSCAASAAFGSDAGSYAAFSSRPPLQALPPVSSLHLDSSFQLPSPQPTAGIHPLSHAMTGKMSPPQKQERRRIFAATAADSIRASVPSHVMTYHAPFTVWDHAKKQHILTEYEKEINGERPLVLPNIAYLLERQNHIEAFFAFSSAITNELIFTQADLSRMRNADPVPALPLGLQGKKRLNGEEEKIAPKIQADTNGLAVAPRKIKLFANGLIDKEVYGLFYPPQAHQNNPEGRQYGLYYFCFVFDHKFKRLL